IGGVISLMRTRSHREWTKAGRRLKSATADASKPSTVATTALLRTTCSKVFMASPFTHSVATPDKRLNLSACGPSRFLVQLVDEISQLLPLLGRQPLGLHQVLPQGRLPSSTQLPSPTPQPPADRT